MTVRAKFTLNYAVEGVRGRNLSFGAVYEGSSELQALSENYIFGKSSPSGSAELWGMGLDHFQQGEEYYFDFVPIDERVGDLKSAILVITAHKIFRSSANPNWPDQPDQFRYSIGSGDVTIGGTFSIGIANKTATQMLDEYQDMQLIVRVAISGRRSDEEIAIRQRMLDDAKANNPTAAGWIAGLEKKLARAKGEA